MRILVVEDDIKIANALKKGLEQESWAVDLEFEGDDGLGAALTIDYDLMILDRMLPGSVDGMSICETLREKGVKTPILMLTAKDKIEDRVFGLNCGADDYLVKPFAFEELVARIKALLRRPENNVGTVLKIGDLSLNAINHKVERSGKEIILSPTEFSLLEYLMLNEGQILTKESIIGHVWDFDADVLPNTVEVYIGYLRNKIDKPFKKPTLINTVRGFGYKIGPN
ncbi:MAG: Two component transcriptional regulator, winged helix family [candidate division CPR2 bacterium GW2011_GWC1_41_48]|uniref:Two component transcriptional regulator, winged helix family n=1 Tax=candidate division CPR2 bacterium GW2011_GWC1_41_48 TaxID=1618344 RepID=A0A0G0YIW7_UNCC2|nr:MAG: Two component transcriptional regulator, winged helix family [candidate division CPR2 bacterium GW2011_GWC2_39_35]KKR28999.1 MAG: Two component transcriptional regulator, winged helix family [candidate division CPR2 bacterium GW2011_GWD2_39_7]KKS09496.1 MAG: Two component transcriptional regulator, winged helix family [candidate division CPR2 bacterium GW2011_GWC1_41_48]OGB70399.1 MAG: DNA-binding response regulator [candidate division CPR2 bacterium GWD2_39_7]